MGYYKAFIVSIIIVKILFILTAILHFYLKLSGNTNKELDENILFLKNRMDFIFIFMMSCLLIYLFYPKRTDVTLDSETKLLLYLFGFVLIFTADWSVFIHESKILKMIQGVIVNKPSQ